MTQEKRFSGIREFIREFKRSKTGLIGLSLVLIFISLSIYVPFAVPLSEMKKWNDLKAWLDNPPAAPPVWAQYLTDKKLPKNEVIEDFIEQRIRPIRGPSTILGILTYRFEYDEFPSSPLITLAAKFHGQPPVIQIDWRKPNGETINLYSFIPQASESLQRFFLSTDPELKKRLAEYIAKNLGFEVDPSLLQAEAVLFAQPKVGMTHASTALPLKGIYEMRVTMLSFDERDELKVLKLAVGGKVFGFFGTDSYRRDLSIGILWGAPVALTIGVTVSLISTLIGLILGVISGFYGGTLKDEAIQRFTDFMISLPTLPILILIAFVFKIDIWQLVLWLTIFGWMGVAKIGRAISLQIREELYVEASRALGARDVWIIFKHVAPQILPYTFAVIALSVPGVILTEASLSFLGLGDPVIVTWGKILSDAQTAGATVNGYWWWVLIPGGLIVLTAMSFGLLGNALDRILHPQLKVR